jgi:hypothetical protein
MIRAPLRLIALAAPLLLAGCGLYQPQPMATDLAPSPLTFQQAEAEADLILSQTPPPPAPTLVTTSCQMLYGQLVCQSY